MQTCNLCPRNCKVNRKLEAGVCGEFDTIRIARASLHMWEEPPISGMNGSGTVFFTGCPLHCVFCQNHNIADGTNGVAITVDELCAVFLKLQEIGAHNINLVTATHFVPDVVSAISKAKENGLIIPIVYNTSGFETFDTLQRLKGKVQIYRSLLVNKHNKIVYEVREHEGIIYIVDFWETRRDPQLLKASHL